MNPNNSAVLPQTDGQHRYLPLVISVVALVVTALLLIPFSPAMPQAGLDESWRSALNEAVVHGYVFGRDLVFTFGPLASVYSTVFNPGTDAAMMIGSTVFAVGVCAALGLAAHPRRHMFSLMVPFVVAISVARDSVFLALPFLLLMAIIRTLLPDSSPLRLRPTPLVLSGIVLATISTSIEPIVKGSFAGAVAACCALAFVALARRSLRMAIAFAAFIVASMSAPWFLAGQQISQLPHYFVAQRPIVSGYTNAMSASGPAWVPVVYLLCAAALSVAFYLSFTRATGKNGLIALTGLIAILFISFKAGMVRQDGHVFVSMGVLLIIGYTVSLQCSLRVAIAILITVAASWFAIGRSVQPIDSAWVHQTIEYTWRATLDGIANRVNDPGNLTREFVLANAQIKEDRPLPHVSGTVDLYPVELSAVFANGLKWAGRPVLQSYSAYEPVLDALNVSHLRSSSAPDTVFFTLDPIDNRLPSLDDSGSLVELLNSYKVVGYDAPYIRMDRDAASSKAAIISDGARTIAGEMDRDIAVYRDMPTWVKVDVQPTLLGRLVSAVYKAPSLGITVKFDDGHTIARRFIASVGQTGFVVSPNLAIPEDVIRLAAGIREREKVASFKIESNHAWLWRTKFNVQLSRIRVEPQSSARALTLTQPTEPPAELLSASTSPAPTCFLDAVNGEPYSAGKDVVAIDHLLKLEGWTAPVDAHHEAIKAWFVLTDSRGMKKYFQSPSATRPDVVRATNDLTLKNAGFSAMIDLVSMPGKQEISILSVSKGVAHICPFKVDVRQN
jgi:hypothetical protein